MQESYRGGLRDSLLLAQATMSKDAQTNTVQKSRGKKLKTRPMSIGDKSYVNSTEEETENQIGEMRLATFTATIVPSNDANTITEKKGKRKCE